MAPDPHSAPSHRLPALDLARGLALVAMVVFHLGWDLSFLGLALVGLRDNEAWQIFGHLIAASFLTLVGVSLVLAHRGGVEPLRFLRRLGMVVAGALAVSVGTYLATPDQVITFGILHHIALGSVLALAFLALPLWLVVGAAGLCFVLPLLVQTDALSGAALAWIGLGTSVPDSGDFVPVFPWFGFILLGVAGARLFDPARLATPEPSGAPARALVWAGRHSLLIYLLHQPILYGGLWLLAHTMAPAPDQDRAGFMAACTRECGANGGEMMRCNAICACAGEALKRENLWREVIAGKVNAQLQQRFGEISRACAASTGESGKSR